MSKRPKSARPTTDTSETTTFAEKEDAPMVDPHPASVVPEIDFDDSNFVEEPIGFPPYWEPEPGRRFVGIPIAKDTSDPTMTRYVIQAGATHYCQRGKKDEQIDVVVAKNEFFSISEYSGLPLERFFGSLIVVTAVGKRAHKPGKTIWEFSVKVSPNAKKLLDAKRLELANLAQAAFLQAQLNPAPKAAAQLGDGKTIEHAPAASA